MAAKTTPIDDLLRQVPIDAIASYEHSPTAHSNYPYGRMCHEAADTIIALRREVEQAKEAVEAISQIFSLEKVALKDRIAQLEAENEKYSAGMQENCQLRREVEELKHPPINEDRFAAFSAWYQATAPKYAYQDELCRVLWDIKEQRIAQLEAERRWIPICERLPQVNSVVLVRQEAIPRTAIKTYYPGIYITHWMPLPQPPEASE